MARINTTMSSTFAHHLESLRPLYSLSYPVPTSQGVLYDKGFDDIYYVAASAVALTLLREVTIRLVLAPAVTAYLRASSWSTRRRAGGREGEAKSNGNGYELGAKAKARIREKEEKKIRHTATRFAEQGWSFLYCCFLWTFGLTILRSIPNYLSAEQLWGTYPLTPITGETKFYYLFQLGWWFHQVYVINVEKRRSDHWQMFSHHILTIALIIGSYLTNYTRVGILVHWLMDLCDIWLPLAKMLRYISLRKLTDATFVLFLVSWIVTRQIGLFFVIRSAYLDAPRFIPFAWAPERRHFLTPTLYYGFIGMLTILLVLCSAWLVSALRIALMVVTGKGAEDVRSDEEDDEPVSAGSTVGAEADEADGALLEQVPQLATGEVNGTRDAVSSAVKAGNGHAEKRK